MYAITMKMPKIKSATELRKSLYQTLTEVARGDPQVITHKRGEAVVLISQAKFNAMIDEKEVLREIALGVAELDSGLGIPHDKVISELKARRKKW